MKDSPVYCLLINILLFIWFTNAEYYEYSKSIKTYYKNYPEMISSASTVVNSYTSNPTPNPPMAYASPAPPSNTPPGNPRYATPPSPIVVKRTYAAPPNTFTAPPVAHPPNASGFMGPPNASGFTPSPVHPPNAMAFPPQLAVPPPIPPRTPPPRPNSRYNRNMKIPPPFV